MIKRLLIPPVALAAATTIAACGSSTAPGVQQAPSAGQTEASVTSTSTTSTTTAPTTPLPAALSKKPKVVPPKGAPPKNLIVKDLIKGTGPAATSSSTVTVQYVGVLFKNGKQFDASWNDGSGKPVQFPLSGVIPGWTQGIPGMRVGGRRELIIPSRLAYGPAGKPPTIPPNSALVFVIDLHAVS
jgi:peptidylprolyl isomerase